MSRILIAEDEARIAAFIDDYMSKPFRFDELLDRIRLRLRDGSTAEVTTIRHGDLELDLRTRRATVGGELVPEFTSREFLLIETFLRNPIRCCRASSC